jgi:glycyl-tRNA synthetase
MLDEGHPAASIRAVRPLVDRPAQAELTLRQLAGLLQTTDGQDLIAAIQRVRRILPAGVAAGLAAGFDPALFDSPAEHALAAVHDKISAALVPSADLRNFATAGSALTGPVNDFFDQVMVMADDPVIRANRLGLLASVYELAGRFLDWEQLP